jgi:AcrR family transcriptional regulator
MARRRLEGADLLAHPIADAAMEVVAERGYQNAKIEEILERARLGRDELEPEFGDKEELVLRVFEAYLDDFQIRVGGAYTDVETWPDNLRAAAYEVVRRFRAHPEVTRFGIVGAMEAGDMARVRREEAFRWAAGLIDAGRALAPDPETVPRSAALVAIGAIVDILRRREDEEPQVDLVAVVPNMMYAAVRPYLGEEAARVEFDIPPPPDLRPPPDPQKLSF